jgi:hypothetical protein
MPDFMLVLSGSCIYTGRRGQSEKDGQTGQPEQDIQKQDIQNRTTARTGQAE